MQKYQLFRNISGDLNKYEFLTRKDLKYKPNALDKARFQFSPLGQTFSIGLDKTAQGYQEEGVIKLLKDIRDSLARPPRHNNNRDENGDDNDDNDYDNRPDDNGYDNKLDDNDGNDDNDNDDNDDNYASENYVRLIAYQNVTIGKLKEELTDKKNLTQDIIDQAKETINESNKERLKYYNKYKNTLFDYTKAENTYRK